MNRYKDYTDELLLYVYIFSYPDSLKEQLALYDELERRGLADWASHMLSELCNIFGEKWTEKEKELQKIGGDA